MGAEIRAVSRVYLCDVTIKLLQVEACGSNCDFRNADGGEDVIKLTEDLLQLGSGATGHQFCAVQRKSCKDRFECSARMDDGRAKWEISAGSDEFHNRNVLIDWFQINAIDFPESNTCPGQWTPLKFPISLSVYVSTPRIPPAVVESQKRGNEPTCSARWIIMLSSNIVDA